MKVCLISNLYPPHARGGAEIVAKAVSEGFRDVGHEVIFITLGRKAEIIQEAGMTFFKIKPFNIFSYLDIRGIPFFLRAPWHLIDMFNIFGRQKIKKILETEKPNLVMTHNLKGIGFLIPKLLKTLNICHVHILHDVQLSRPSGIIYYGREKPFLILDKFYEKVCVRLFGSPALIISPSQWLLDYYNKRGFFPLSKKKVLRNPIDRIYTPMKKNLGEKRILLFAGQLTESKGIHFLIETLKEWKRDDWILKIAGIGNREKDLKKLVEGDNRFQWYGYVKPVFLGRLLEQADCTLIPSLCYENSPMIIYESFARGVPVIASDIGGISEVVTDHVNGFTFEPKDQDNFLQTLEFFLNHPEKRQKLRENAIQTVQGLTKDQYVRKIFECMKDIL